MRAKQLAIELKKIFNSNDIIRAHCLEGSPGGGKTSIIQQVVKQLNGWGYYENHMPTMLVEDFGIPLTDAESGTLKYLLPDWYPSIHRTDIPDKGVLCFDDRNQASADLQKVLANIIQARTLHGVPMKEGWRIISTGNRQSDRAGANKILSHLRNRETVLELETLLEDWTDWSLVNGVRQELISFMHFRPNLLHDFDPQRDINPTPRAWVDGVNPVMGVVSKESEPEFFKGAVGEGAAAEFVGYLEICQSMPDPLRVLREPKVYPTDGDIKAFTMSVKYALSGALSEHVTNKTIGNMISFLSRIEPEFCVLALNCACRKQPELQETDEFTAWAVKNQQYVIR